MLRFLGEHAHEITAMESTRDISGTTGPLDRVRSFEPTGGRTITFKLNGGAVDRPIQHDDIS
jgi:hypothetical protein